MGKMEIRIRISDSLSWEKNHLNPEFMPSIFPLKELLFKAPFPVAFKLLMFMLEMLFVPAMPPSKENILNLNSSSSLVVFSDVGKDNLAS